VRRAFRFERQPSLADFDLVLLADVEAGVAKPLDGEAEHGDRVAAAGAVGDGGEAAASAAGVAAALAAVLGFDGVADLGDAGGGAGEGLAVAVLGEDLQGLRFEVVDEAVVGGAGRLREGGRGGGGRVGKLIRTSAHELLLLRRPGCGGGGCLCRTRFECRRPGRRAGGGHVPSSGVRASRLIRVIFFRRSSAGPPPLRLDRCLRRREVVSWPGVVVVNRGSCSGGR
jgi:hypothetical protein